MSDYQDELDRFGELSGYELISEDEEIQVGDAARVRLDGWYEVAEGTPESFYVGYTVAQFDSINAAARKR